MRKFFFILLVLIGFALFGLGMPAVQGLAVGSPSQREMPVAWQDKPRLTLRSADLPACDHVLPAAPGEDLPQIAARCGVRLTDLRRANPALADVAGTLDGLLVNIPPACPGELCGGGSDLLSSGSPIPAPHTRAGGTLRIQAAGLGANTPYTVSIGLSAGTFTAIAEGVADPWGRAQQIITLPADALPGDSAFLLLTTQGTPARQAVSESFQIAQP